MRGLCNLPMFLLPVGFHTCLLLRCWTSHCAGQLRQMGMLKTIMQFLIILHRFSACSSFCIGPVGLVICQALSAEELAGALMAAGVDLKAVDPKDCFRVIVFRTFLPCGENKIMPKPIFEQDVLLALDPHGCKQIFVPDLIQVHVFWLQQQGFARLQTHPKSCHTLSITILK